MARLHDRRRTDVRDLPAGGLPVTLVWIKRDESMRVSHERIDTWLFVQTRAVLDPELTARLRTRRVRRRPRRRLTAAASKHIPAITSIRERPVEALYRRQPAHREGDLLVGRFGRRHLVTLVERHSRYLMVGPVNDATSGTVITP